MNIDINKLEEHALRLKEQKNNFSNIYMTILGGLELIGYNIVKTKNDELSNEMIDMARLLDNIRRSSNIAFDTLSDKMLEYVNKTKENNENLTSDVSQTTSNLETSSSTNISFD